MDPQNHLSPEEEVKRYDLHENHIRSPGYEGFLNQVILPVIARARLQWNKHLDNPDNPDGDLVYQGPALRALDYGSGPYPMLSQIMAERGIPMELYDPFYAPRSFSSREEEHYHIITCCEVAEHFHDPAREFSFLTRLLTPGGLLAIMTGIRYPHITLAGWHYLRDETHTSIYSPATMTWIARKHGLTLTFAGKNVCLFEKMQRKETLSLTKPVYST